MDTTTTALSAPLRLTPELMETIRGCSFNGLKALPRRGAEVGGLITAAGSSLETAEELRLVRCEHLYGPSWHLSASDLLGLRDSFRQCEAEGKAIAAYFRSCTRPLMTVDTEDREAIAFACPDVPFVVISKPLVNGSARICVFSRDPDGNWNPGKELDVPFSAASVPSPAPVAAPAMDVASSGGTGGAVRAPRQPADTRQRAELLRELPREAPRQARVQPRWILSAAVFVLCVCAIALWLKAKSPNLPGAARVGAREMNATSATNATSAPSATPSNDPRLGLSVREENGRFHVIWNRDSATASSAISGLLEISDSGTLKSIPLLRVDITGGSVVYGPRSSDVTFRLQLRNSEGKPVEEMIRVIGNEPVGRNAAPTGTARFGSTPVPALRTTPAVTNRAPPPPEYREPSAVVRTRSEGPETAQTAVQTPVQSPVTEPAAPKPTAAQPPRSETPTPATVESAQPLQHAQSAPPADPRPPASAPHSPAAIPAVPVAVITPPQPLRRVLPTKRGLNFTLYAPVKVGITVEIDEKGRILQARADPGYRGSNPFLLGMALNAAKAWTFKPATRSGQPIRGEFRIEFIFPKD